MNERDWIKSLDRPAGTIPPVDVVHSVLADIRRTPAADAPDTFLRVLTLTSSVAAVAIAVVATSEVYSTLSDPIRALAGSWAMVMQ